MWPAVGLALFLGGSAPAATPEVWKTWSDGQAELGGYQLTQPRYGQLRKGTAVLVYVTEPFSDSARVKADPGKHPSSDVYPVLKLNFVKDFQTGIYDYNLMSSLFVKMDGGAAVKLTFSSQEWCGNLFEELLIDPTSIHQRRFSYFDGEGDQDVRLEKKPSAILLEELFVKARNLPDPFLDPGESKTITILTSLERSRLLHRPIAFREATVARSRSTQKRVVPAGTFDVETLTADLGEGERWIFYVERASPRRLIAWEGPDGERAELKGTKRLKYWELNQEGGEKYLRELGL